MSQSMGQATKVLGQLNGMQGVGNLNQIGKVISNFQRSMDMIDQKGEMMDDALDDLMDDELEMEDQEEIDEIVSKVLDEVGINLNSQLETLPSSQEQLQQQQNRPLAAGKQPLAEGMDNDLEARLSSLKR